MDKNSPIPGRLTAAVAALMDAPDRKEAYEAALKAYRENPQDDAARDALISEIGLWAAVTKPVETILAEAWTTAIARASEEGRIKPLDEGPASTVFGDVWAPLAQDGWNALPDYRQEDLAEALAQTTRNITFSRVTRPGGEPAEIATALLAGIEAGHIPHGRGAGDFFINWADGSPLDISMENWAPVLTDRSPAGRAVPPRPRPDGKVFKTMIDFPSGRALVADSVRISPLPERLSDMRRTCGLNINYGCHRILRTSMGAFLLGAIDVAMGDDGPGLVRAPGSDMIFAGDEGEGFPEIANVCHDYWGTIMIDRSRLAGMMVEEGVAADAAAAEAEIDAWLGASCFHTEIELPAGIWYFYWDDDRETLDRELRAAGIAAPRDTRFVLSREPIALDANKVRDMTVQDKE